MMLACITSHAATHAQGLGVALEQHPTLPPALGTVPGLPLARVMIPPIFRAFLREGIPVSISIERGKMKGRRLDEKADDRS